MIRKYYQYEKIEGSERKTIELISEEAFREAIANALMHRDWDADSNINVFMHKIILKSYHLEHCQMELQKKNTYKVVLIS